MNPPMRTCVGCRQSVPKGDLLRLVVREGTLVVDPGAVADGRGVYVHDTESCWTLARRRGGFARSLRRAVGVPEHPFG
ncbi:MAG TPA: YlxR family protein [Propionibacteriaceae bacterium]|nr:YlxR family protein [Propionibacteriaceae bacterium]